MPRSHTLSWVNLFIIDSEKRIFLIIPFLEIRSLRASHTVPWNFGIGSYQDTRRTRCRPQGYPLYRRDPRTTWGWKNRSSMWSTGENRRGCDQRGRLGVSTLTHILESPCIYCCSATSSSLMSQSGLLVPERLQLLLKHRKHTQTFARTSPRRFLPRLPTRSGSYTAGVFPLKTVKNWVSKFIYR